MILRIKSMVYEIPVLSNRWNAIIAPRVVINRRLGTLLFGFVVIRGSAD